METSYNFNEDCSMKVMRENGISSEKVEKCVQDSFVRSREGSIVDNRILKEDAQWAKQ